MFVLIKPSEDPIAHGEKLMEEAKGYALLRLVTMSCVVSSNKQCNIVCFLLIFGIFFFFFKSHDW